MAAADSIQHFLRDDGIRLTVVSINTAAQTAQANHAMSSLAAGLLAQSMTGAALLANDFKNKEGVSLKWYTEGSAGIIYADAYDGRFVRGYADGGMDLSLAYSSKAESQALSGAGKLIVTRYSLLKRAYTSAVDLSVSSVSDGIGLYLSQSDQTLSSVHTWVSLDDLGKIKQAGGYLAQLLPGGNADAFHALFPKGKIYTQAESSASSIDRLVKEQSFILLSQNELSFRCTCSEEKIKEGILSLPPSEQRALLEDEMTEVVCHYCGKVYTFPRDTLSAWVKEQETEVHHG